MASPLLHSPSPKASKDEDAVDGGDDEDQDTSSSSNDKMTTSQ